MNENQAMLIAFLLSDGSVYFDKSKEPIAFNLRTNWRAYAKNSSSLF